MACVTAGWDACNARAAALTLPPTAMAMKARRARRFGNVKGMRQQFLIPRAHLQRAAAVGPGSDIAVGAGGA